MSHSDAENDDLLANASPSRSPSKRPKRRRPDRSYVKLRKRGKRAPVVKYEEIEPEVEERLSDSDDKEEEEDEDEKGEKEEKEKEEKEEEEEEEEEEVSDQEEDEEDSNISSPSNVRNLRKKGRPLSLGSKKLGRSKKFSDLMKRSRKQAQSYGMKFNRTGPAQPATSPPQPATGPAQPAISPAQPAISPVQPATSPAQPATSSALPTSSRLSESEPDDQVYTCRMLLVANLVANVILLILCCS